MAPEPSSGHGDPPAGDAPPAAGPTPEGFEHERYEHDLPGSDVPFVGPMINLAGAVLDATQRARLAEGLATRAPGSIPHTNANSFEHVELKRMIDDSKAAQVHELGEMWNDLGNEIMDFGAGLHRISSSSEAIWVGQAGSAARTTLTGLATWSQQTGQGVQYMGTTMRSQAEAAQTAKASMPDPVDYNPAEYQDRLNSTSNPFEWIQIIGDAREQADRSNGARAEAVRVTETYSTSLHETSATMPAFTPPQAIDNGDTGLTPGGPMPGGGGGLGGGGVPTAGGTGGGVPGGVPGISGGGGSPGAGPDVPDVDPTPPQSTPPQSTPPQSVPHVPGIPGAPGSGGHGPGGGTGVPGFVPAAAGAGGPAAGRGPGMGGGRGGGFGPGGSGGPGASNSLGRGGFGATGTAGATGAAEGAAGAGRGAAGMTGRGGGGAFAPMAGGARGQGSEDSEHRRPGYLLETEDVWGDGRRVAPPVIGEDPPEYYR